MQLADIMIWPTVGAPDFVWLIGFIIFMILTFVVINLLFRRQKSLFESKTFAYAESIGRNFSPEESIILKKFINQLDDDKKDILSTTKNWKFLRKDLYNYLLDSKTSPELAVRIFDRLFLQFRADHSFHAGDLQPGEMAALITEYGEELTRVAKSTNEDVLLSSNKTLLPTMVKNLPAKIYIFRPREGGYFIKGYIVGSMNEAILFHIEGKPEHAGHAHLMIQEKFQVEILNWPRFTEDSFFDERNKERIEAVVRNEDANIEEDLTSLELEIRKRFGKPKKETNPGRKESSKVESDNYSVQKEIQKIKNIEFFCIAMKLSDRGLLFELPESVSPEFWRESELWELKFQMPGGRYVETKSKIFPSSGSKSRFIAKFIDMEESLRIAIYEDIKSFGGDREVLR